MRTADSIIGELDWTPVGEQLYAHGTCIVRFTFTTDGVVAELLPFNPAEQSEFRTLSGAHCATCQCNKLHSTAPVPKNPQSKSWHENAPDGPNK
jgi:hypothetical protein